MAHNPIHNVCTNPSQKALADHLWCVKAHYSNWGITCYAFIDQPLFSVPVAVTVLTVEATLQNDRFLQAQTFNNGLLDTLGGRGSTCQERRFRKQFLEAVQLQIGWPAPTANLL